MPTPEMPRRSPLGLIVLWQLMSEPMHVYRMQKLFEEEGKSRVVNVRSRASLYQAIERLVRYGLVEVAETVKVEGYPDRTVYAITPRGREVAREWLSETLASTDGEYPEFVAGVSILFGLDPQEARLALERREQALAAALTETDRVLTEETPADLPRLFVLEEEYRKVILGAELEWLHRVIADLRDGRLTWSEEWLREVAARFLDHD